MGSVMSKLFYRSQKMTPDRWILEATEDQITAGFMNLIIEGEDGHLSPSFTKEQLSAYRKTFDSMSVSKSPTVQYIDEAAFTSFLSRHFHRSYPSFAVAAPTLYKTARSHAAYPFTANPPETLSADSFLRAITMLTGRVRAVLDSPVKLSGVARGPDGTKSIETTLINPGRSERDVRRLVFQSIAVPAGKRDQAKQRSELIDDDLADVRIVASRAQPRPDYCYAPRPWKEFLPMAVRLSVPRPPLEDLHVPYEVLRELLKLLLAVQSSDQSAAAAEDAATLDSQAAALLRIAGSEGEDVGFEGFEKVYEGLGRREGLLENGMMEELRVPTPSGRLVLKPDMLQCLARVFEVFVAPDNEAWVKS